MGGTDLRGHVVTPDQLSEAERRLYDLARTSTPLAEIGVRLGLPITEVDRRLDLLVTRLGLPDRMALREPLPGPVIDASEETIDFTDAAAAPAVTPHFISRRSLIIGGASAVGLAAAGAVGGVFLAGRGGDGDQPPTQADSTSTPEPRASVTPAPGAGLDLIEPVDGAYERRTFAPGEEIDWAHGIFFMNVESGEVDAWRLAPRLGDANIGAYRLPAPRYIEMLTADFTTRILIDRESEAAWSYPADLLELSAAVVGPNSVHRLLFEELRLEPGRQPGLPTGRFHSCVDGFGLRSSFESPAVRFGPEPLISPDGTRVLTVTEVNGQYALRLFELHTGEQIAESIIPLSTSTTVNAQWHREMWASGFFAVRLSLPWNPGESPRTLRVQLPWSGLWPPVTPGNLDAPRSVFYSADGFRQLHQESLRDVPAESLGGGETWPVVELQSETSNGRVRSASLFYGDGIPDRRWTANGSWFFAMVASEATEGPGFERARYAAIRDDLAAIVPIDLEPPPGSSWFHGVRHRGPVPHPGDPWLVALGHLEIAHFDPGAATPIDRFTSYVRPVVTSESGPDHIDPWSGNPNEMVFVIGHGGHDGGWPGAMITPSVEEPPFEDDGEVLRFVVARAGDCVNLREGPSLTSAVLSCLMDGTELEIWDEARGSGLEDNVAFVRNEDGAWVAVRLPDGTTGWLSSAYLDWA